MSFRVNIQCTQNVNKGLPVRKLPTIVPTSATNGKIHIAYQWIDKLRKSLTMDVEVVCGTVETRPIRPLNLADHPKKLLSPSVAVGTIIITLK
jgi:hypothetical protein